MFSPVLIERSPFLSFYRFRIIELINSLLEMKKTQSKLMIYAQCKLNSDYLKIVSSMCSSRFFSVFHRMHTLQRIYQQILKFQCLHEIGIPNERSISHLLQQHHGNKLSRKCNQIIYRYTLILQNSWKTSKTLLQPAAKISCVLKTPPCFCITF